MTVGAALAVMLAVVAVATFFVRVLPVLRHGRTTTLPRPAPGPLEDAQRAADKLIAAGFDAEVVEHDDHGTNMWANTNAGGSVHPSERYVVRVPRRQAEAAARL
ncbi:MAG: hypothetical protein RL238_515 [Actinomycetota bacterium]|jgi:hypothetical protein